VGCTQDYAAPSGENELVIKQSAGRLLLPGPGPGGWTAIRVRGLPGRATRNLITWREDGLTDLIMVASPQWPQVLTTAQLVAIADSALCHVLCLLLPKSWPARLVSRGRGRG